MNAKKNPSKDLENKRIILFEIGAIITLVLVFMAFEWKTYDIIDFDTNWNKTAVIIDELPVIITKQEKKIEIPKPKLQISELIIKPDDFEVDDVKIDAGTSQDEVIKIYEPTIPKEEVIPEPDLPLLYSEIQPEFPGGIENLHLYLKNNIEYPGNALNINLTGKVFISFVVEKDGSISNVKLLRGIGGGCDEEALRVVKNMPKWNPGKQNYIPVRVQMTLPIEFKLY